MLLDTVSALCMWRAGLVFEAVLCTTCRVCLFSCQSHVVHRCPVRPGMCDSVPVTILFVPKREGKLEALTAFDVEGVRNPLAVSVLGEVKGMVFACSVADPLAPPVATSVTDAAASVPLPEADAYTYVLLVVQEHRSVARTAVVVLDICTCSSASVGLRRSV